MDQVVKAELETHINASEDLSQVELVVATGLYVTIMQDFMSQVVSDYAEVATMTVKEFYDKCMEVRVQDIREELKEDEDCDTSGNVDGDELSGET